MVMGLVASIQVERTDLPVIYLYDAQIVKG